MSGTTYFNSQSLDGVQDATLSGNLYANNIIMSSNMSTNSGQGNLYFSGNLVVNGNIFSLGGSVGSGSGTSQGVTFTLPSSYSLVSAGGTQPFSNGVAGPNISGFNINLNQFTPQAVQAVTSFSSGTGMLKFATGGLYQVQCVLVGDQPVAKVGIGSTTSSTFPPTASPTSNYVYVYNFPLNSSPSEVVTIPLTITDTTKWYYLDAYFSNIAGTPTVLYQTAPPSGSAAGSNYGTYVQVSPFGNYLTSATGVASGLLMNCSTTTTLSAPVSSNTFRLAMTSSNGWTVNGVSTSLTVTSGGNFQINQVGIYEVSLCLNTVGVTPMMFGVGSLATDTAPGTQGPYLYQYAPMYTQDPTTVVNLPLNITDTAKYYYVDVIFPGTQATVALSNVSTYVALRPVGSYVNPSTNPWSQQGTSVYYQDGAVAIGGLNPSLLTETLTINGNTSFVGNVTVTSDAAGSSYVNAKRVPAGSLDVTRYVNGSVPLTTTTNLIQKYLSNAAAITSNTSTGTITQALSLPGTTNSFVNFPSGGVSPALANLATSNLFIEAWINPATSPQGGIICRANGTGPSNQDFRFFITSGGVLTFTVVNSGGSQVTASNATALVAGTWYHVVACYQALSLTTGTVRVFTNGGVGGNTGSLTTNQPRLTAGTNIYIGTDVLSGGSGSGTLSGNVADVRIFSGSLIVPTATFASPASAPFTQSAPSYATNMGLVGTANTVLALQSQYFPGASTSPYGPVLTLPGTVGSYYNETGTFLNTSLNSGFTIEAWVNYASLANSNGYANGGLSYMMGKMNPTSGAQDWFFGVLTSGQLSLNFYNSTANYSISTAGTITTGSWNHLVCQSNTAGIVNMYINGVQQTLQAGGYTGSGTGVALNGTVSSTNYSGITLGQWSGSTGPNFAVAKARVLFGANTYTTTTFTPNPNLGAVPVGGTVAWQLESQYPLPSYPSFFDVPVLSAQTPAYGAEPVPVGGVTSNVLSPFSTLDSIRFDGTGYIDYGNAASSALTSNIWASPWTIEAWVYTSTATFSASQPIVTRAPSYSVSTYPFDFYFWIQTTGQPQFYWNTTGTYVVGGSVSIGWNHVAVVNTGTAISMYLNGTQTGTTTTPTNPFYTPSYSLYIGSQGPALGTYYTGGTGNLSGNLADVRVSNVARYTGSSYTVPTAPFTTDSNTLLLLKSLAGQVGTTLEVQGRGLGTTSLGAGRVVQSYPPAPMTSYLLDTTSNSSVTYGVGKYVASASSEYVGYSTWVYNLFDYNSGNDWASASPGGTYNGTSPYTYNGSVVTVDVLGNSYIGEWAQLQMPVSVILSSYVVTPNSAQTTKIPSKFYILGSRDGINWTLVDSRTGIIWSTTAQTFIVSATQGYNFYRMVVNQVNGSGGVVDFTAWLLYGTEEALCITSDSKVGVGIANPQRALEVAGDMVVGGTVSAGNPLMYRNRIINGDMRIAQRGTSNVMATSAIAVLYGTVDRFGIYSSITSGSITTTQQTLVAADTPFQTGLRYSWRLTTTVPLVIGYFLPTYTVEGLNIADFMWGTSFGQPVTMSFWLRSNISNGSIIHISFRNGSVNYSYNAPVGVTNSGGWQYVTFTVPPPPNGSTWASDNTAGIYLGLGAVHSTLFSTAPNTWQNSNYMGVAGYTPWWNNAGNYIEFTGVQLEKGTVATPFEFRPYATELILCQTWNPGTSAVSGSTNICLATNGGNVGIGTTAPGATLDVMGSSTISTPTYIFLRNGGGGVNGTGSDLTTTQVAIGNPAYGPWIRAVQPATYYTDGFRLDICTNITNNDTTPIPRISVLGQAGALGNARVGIGSTSPVVALDVVGAIRSTASFTRTTPSSIIAFAAPGAGLTSAGYNGVMNAGNDVADQKLSIFINGSARSADGGTNGLTIRNDGGPFTLGSTGYVTTVLSSSDYRNKQNVVPYSNCLADVLTVPVIKYTYVVTDTPDVQYSGWFAHEVQAVAPYAVRNNKDEVDEEGKPVYQGVDAIKLVPILWGAVQELSAQNKALEADLETARNDISSLESRLAAIEARLAQ